MGPLDHGAVGRRGGRRRLAILVAALGWGLTLAAWQPGPDVPALQPPVLVVEAPVELGPVVARVRAFDPERLLGVMRLVGLDAPGDRIRVVLIAPDSELAHTTPAWISGFAFGADGTVFLLPDRTPGYPDDSLEALLHHEVAHVLITRAAGGRPLPRWFNEGLALVAERTWGLEDRTRVAFELLGSERIPLDDLDALFRQDPRSIARAYALSGAFVRDVLRQHGPDGAARILSLVAAGVPFPDAFARATGLSLRLAESAFWRRTLWTHWVPILTSSVVLWIGITFLALAAIRKRRRRSAELRRRWEEEEAAQAARVAQVDDSPETIH